MSSITIKCADCGKDFYFTDRDQAYYKEHDYDPPKRCFNCRKERKAKFNSKPGEYQK